MKKSISRLNSDYTKIKNKKFYSLDNTYYFLRQILQTNLCFLKYPIYHW